MKIWSLLSAIMVLVFDGCLLLLLPPVREFITGFADGIMVHETSESVLEDVELLTFGITGIVVVVVSLIGFVVCQNTVRKPTV